jgi:hypothetical protein
MDQIESTRVNTVQTGRTSPFAENPLSFSDFTKIPFRRRKFFAV